jgi:PAS domain-containing protein
MGGLRQRGIQQRDNDRGRHRQGRSLRTGEGFRDVVWPAGLLERADPRFPQKGRDSCEVLSATRTATRTRITRCGSGRHLAGNAIERLRAEQRLREDAERFDLAEKTAAFGIWQVDIRTGQVSASEGFAPLVGLAGPNATIYWISRLRSSKR